MLCHDTSHIHVAWLVYLACLRSHVLPAYCNFKSKQAISITLFVQERMSSFSLDLGDAQIISNDVAMTTPMSLGAVTRDAFTVVNRILVFVTGVFRGKSRGQQSIKINH